MCEAAPSASSQSPKPQIDRAGRCRSGIDQFLHAPHVELRNCHHLSNQFGWLKWESVQN